eukprot:4326199-Lingulodinium_polyedra.AAC.1
MGAHASPLCRQATRQGSTVPHSAKSPSTSTHERSKHFLRTLKQEEPPLGPSKGGAKVSRLPWPWM